MSQTYEAFSDLTEQRNTIDARIERLAAQFVHEWMTEHGVATLRIDDENETPSYALDGYDADGQQVWDDPLSAGSQPIDHAIGWLPKSVISNPTRPAWNPQVTVADLAAYLAAAHAADFKAKATVQP